MRSSFGRLGRGGAAVFVTAVLVLAGCGGGGGTASYKEPVGPAISTVTIESGNLFFKPKTVTLTPPGIYELKLANTQTGEHTLVFGDKVPGFRLDVMGPGSTQQAKIDLKAGSYTFWCDLPGHRAAGMEGKITVQ
jgi:uncharacterized cupredoxin-like copper-binding protein